MRVNYCRPSHHWHNSKIMMMNLRLIMWCGDIVLRMLNCDAPALHLFYLMKQRASFVTKYSENFSLRHNEFFILIWISSEISLRETRKELNFHHHCRSLLSLWDVELSLLVTLTGKRLENSTKLTENEFLCKRVVFDLAFNKKCNF